MNVESNKEEFEKIIEIIWYRRKGIKVKNKEIKVRIKNSYNSSKEIAFNGTLKKDIIQIFGDDGAMSFNDLFEAFNFRNLNDVMITFNFIIETTFRIE